VVSSPILSTTQAGITPSRWAECKPGFSLISEPSPHGREDREATYGAGLHSADVARPSGLSLRKMVRALVGRVCQLEDGMLTS
jgi:hypothetical protein